MTALSSATAARAECDAARLRELRAKATPGEWAWVAPGYHVLVVALDGRPQRPRIASVDTEFLAGGITDWRAKADAALIAAAVNALVPNLDRIAVLEGLLREARPWASVAYSRGVLDGQERQGLLDLAARIDAAIGGGK